ncbi:MAG: thioredoxin-dependent thiol peroxidase [bacterium]|nr:thioredoxin-dependent thiol peroxidase [bacterium]
MLKKGNKAPEFSLPDQNSKIHSLKDYLGKWVLVYFYPKDDTPGCTKEACAIRDDYSSFKKIKAVVLGISVDNVKSHAKFVKKYKLPFTLLSDENKEVVKKYGVWQKKKFMPARRSLGAGGGREYMGTLRNSFLINPEGKIAKIYEKVVPELHGKEVLADLKELSKK